MVETAPPPLRDAPPQASREGITSAGAPMRIGTVALTVRDLDGVSRFYEDVIGLKRLDTGKGRVRLGAGDAVLLDLRHVPEARPASRRAAGLFHTAFLLPTREDLAQWLLHASARGTRLQGASDHLVSEAIYLADPEGNGIEVYADRPSAAWPRQGSRIEMATLPLDIEGLLGTVKAPRFEGLPLGSMVGHVHLQVGELAPAERFYADLLGFEVTSRYPGAVFYGAGGYHHHLATNVWNSRGAGRREDGCTGLAAVELVPADGAVWTALRERLRAATGVEDADGLRLNDPWGTTIAVRAA